MILDIPSERPEAAPVTFKENVTSEPEFHCICCLNLTPVSRNTWTPLGLVCTGCRLPTGVRKYPTLGPEDPWGPYAWRCPGCKKVPLENGKPETSFETREAAEANYRAHVEQCPEVVFA